MKLLFPVLFTLAVIGVVGLSASVEAQTASSPRKGATIEKLLKESGVAFEPFQGEDSFISVYEGKVNKQISVIVIEADAAVVITTDVVAGKEVDLTPAVLRSLLEYNLKADYIKVGISDMKSVRVQTEEVLKGLTPETFKVLIDQVAAGNDEVAKIIQPVRKKAASTK